ncbi:MAG: hypothetical protein H7240_04115 [Glaciimonas sp.]|nr:hypothetical protein [Glaciimonas sp.]
MVESEKSGKKYIFLNIWVALVLFQTIFWFDLNVFLAGVAAVVGGSLGIFVFFRRERLIAYPISSLMLLGYSISYFILPPLVTLSEGKSLINNLENPVLVSVHALLCFLFLIFGHGFYRRSRTLKRLRFFIANQIYQPLGFFRIPSNGHLLIMGSIGITAMIYQIFFVGAVKDDILGADNKLIQALYPLAYLPYCMLVRPLIGDYLILNKKIKVILFFYTLLLVAVSLGANSRAAFLLGLMSILLSYFYGVAINLYSARIFSVRNFLFLIAVVFTAQGPVSDLATSMVIARQQRSDISAVQLLQETIYVYQDKKAIEGQRKEDVAFATDWDERYIDNLFLSRLSNLKFADNSIVLATNLDEPGRSRIRDLEWQRVLAVYPRPIIDFFGWSVDKDLVGGSSGGDLLLYSATSDFYALKGFRTGSIFGSGYAMFYWFYPLIFSFLAVILFVLADAQTTRRRHRRNILKANNFLPIFNPLAIVTVFTWFFYLTSAATGVESLSGLTQFILRGWIQVVFVYAFAYWTGYVILRLVFKRVA